MIWLVIGSFVALMLVAGLVAWLLCESPVEIAKREQLAAIRARALRANYELDQASFAIRRAVSDAVQKGLRDRDS